MESDQKWVSGKYDFTEDEKDAMGRKLAEAQKALETLQAELAAEKQKFKDKMEPVAKQIHQLAEKITSGFEFREYRCRAERDYKNGETTWRDIESERVILVEPFSQEDRQRRFI